MARIAITGDIAAAADDHMQEDPLFTYPFAMNSSKTKPEVVCNYLYLPITNNCMYMPHVN